MLQRIFATGLALCCLFTASAQQTAAPADSVITATPTAGKPVLTVSADAYYRYDLGKTASNDFTSFTHSHNSFELGMISLKAEHSIGKVGLVADVGFGKRAEEFSYTDENTRFIIKQLNLSYTIKNKGENNSGQLGYSCRIRGGGGGTSTATTACRTCFHTGRFFTPG